MKLGFFTMPMHPRSKDWRQCLTEDREAFILADKLGFTEGYCGEHATDLEENITSSAMFLATLADATKNIRLGTGTTNMPNSHPVATAGNLAMLDHLLGGRFIFGISPGALPSDAEAFGNSDMDRAAMFLEAINHVLALWTMDPPYRLKGQFWNITTEKNYIPETGMGTVPKPLLPPVALPALLPPDVTTWINQAIDEHPVLRQAAVALEVAQLETRKAQAGNLPTLDLNGSFAMARNDGSSTTRVNSSTNTTSVALAFNLPLFAGYAIQNRIKETIALEDKARSDLEAARRTISQNTRAAFFGVLSGQGQVKALEAAEASSQSALDANKLGYQVGVRINLDVLNAQSQLFQTKRDLARARYDVLVGGLRLRQANGSLKPDDIQAINSLLVK